MATRHLPGDPNYSTAVNLIPIEFAKEASVIAAYTEYKRAVGQDQPVMPAHVARVDTEISTAQVKMVSAILQSLGMKVSEADLAVSAYAADGMVKRDNLYLDSLRAQLRIAEALEKAQN